MKRKELIEETGFTSSEILPTTTCDCYGRKNSNCQKCDGKGVIKNSKYPHDGMCKSGHYTKCKRFFKVSGRKLKREFWGIYCEDCIRVAYKIANKIKNRSVYGSN